MFLLQICRCQIVRNISSKKIIFLREIYSKFFPSNKSVIPNFIVPMQINPMQAIIVPIILIQIVLENIFGNKYPKFSMTKFYQYCLYFLQIFCNTTAPSVFLSFWCQSEMIFLDDCANIFLDFFLFFFANINVLNY